MDVGSILRAAGIRPSSHRIKVAEYVLRTSEHPSAEQVYERVQGELPVLSRGTVYNTLNLLVEKGLLRALVLHEGRTVFDPCLERHHHFIDDVTGEVVDVPWDAVQVGAVSGVRGIAVREYMVVMRGRKLGTPAASDAAGTPAAPESSIPDRE